MKKTLAFVLAFALVAGASLPMNTGNILKSDTAIVANARGHDSCYVEEDQNGRYLLYLAGNVTSDAINSALSSAGKTKADITFIYDNYGDTPATLPEDCSHLFANFTGLVYTRLNNVDGSNVKKIDYMYAGCTNVGHIDVGSLNPTVLADTSTGVGMFDGCNSLRILVAPRFANGITANMGLSGNWLAYNETTEDYEKVVSENGVVIPVKYFNETGTTVFNRDDDSDENSGDSGNTGGDSGDGNSNGENSDKTTEVSYEPQEAYTITIPAAVSLNDTTGVTETIQASNVMIDEGKAVCVTLSGASNTQNGSSTFHVKKGNSTATYTISGSGGNTIAVGEPVTSFSENGSFTLTFSKATGATHAGKHTETLTFTFEVKDL